MCAADNAGPGARFDRQQWRQDNLRFASGRSMDHYQVSAVFSKTGVTRQTRLVQLILGSVAPMGD